MCPVVCHAETIANSWTKQPASSPWWGSQPSELLSPSSWISLVMGDTSQMKGSLPVNFPWGNPIWHGHFSATSYCAFPLPWSVVLVRGGKGTSLGRLCRAAWLQPILWGEGRKLPEGHVGWQKSGCSGQGPVTSVIGTDINGRGLDCIICN